VFAVVVALRTGYLRRALSNLKTLLTFWFTVGLKPVERHHARRAAELATSRRRADANGLAGDAMAALIRVARRAWAAESGAELIGFAIALPILLLVITGILDFAILFQRYEVVSNAAREGARVAILPDFTEDQVKTRVNNYLAASGLTGTAPAPTVTYGTTVLGAGGPTVNVVTVVVKYPHQFVFIGPAAALVGAGSMADITLAAAATMRTEAAAAP
jgi:Flp pilus assembly protein TadG